MVNPLDGALSAEVLFSSDTDEAFEQVLLDTDECTRKIFLGYSGAKFMLLQEQNGSCYLRIQHNEYEREHRDIVRGFGIETGVNPSTIVPRGGGDVKASRKNRRTELCFYDRSDTFGKFDRELLRTLLNTYLDKRVDYRIE